MQKCEKSDKGLSKLGEPFIFAPAKRSVVLQNMCRKFCRSLENAITLHREDYSLMN
jgi:hypothetical protein